MNLTVEPKEFEEVKQYKITATFLFTQEQLDSDKTFTIKELFDAMRGEDDIEKIVKANINLLPQQILQAIKNKFASEGKSCPTDQVLMARIEDIKAR